MEIIRGLHNLCERHQACVVTIGNFDGIHLGHQKLLQRLLAIAAELQLPSVAIIFEPQPNEFLANVNSVPRLMRFREKVEAFNEAGIDHVLCLRFDEKIALQVADVFVRTILVEKLAAKYVLVGDDFRFGYKRMGDFKLLQELGEKYHFKTEAMATTSLNGERVSSTLIRRVLEQGDMVKASLLLGRPFGMKGRVAHGDKRGRILGFPTANIHLHRKLIPIKGVFAVEMLGIEPRPVPGVANIGTRPTVEGTRTLLEVHLLNFNRDIYGSYVEVRFLQKFRDEIKFNSLDELKIQIQKDLKRAAEFHNVGY